jgi:hypothetical protein
MSFIALLQSNDPVIAENERLHGTQTIVEVPGDAPMSADQEPRLIMFEGKLYILIAGSFAFGSVEIPIYSETLPVSATRSE